MAYVPHIPDWFLTRKAAQAVAFFALKSGGRIKVLMATKLMYLSDRRSMEIRDFPITNDQYVSMKFGPVNSYTYDYMQGKAAARKNEWLDFIAPRQGDDLVLASEKIGIDDLDELSRGDSRYLKPRGKNSKISTVSSWLSGRTNFVLNGPALRVRYQ
ncbi:SocA family protein [Agrobacterium sp. S2]|nr:SocA family protein [Agrobacterium sp. S2]